MTSTHSTVATWPLTGARPVLLRVLSLLLVAILIGCSGSGAGGDRVGSNDTPANESQFSSATTEPSPGVPSTAAPAATASVVWRERVSAACGRAGAAMASIPRPDFDADAASYALFADAHRAGLAQAGRISQIPGIPAELASVVTERDAGVDAALTAVAHAAAVDDASGARRGVDNYDYHLSGIASAAARAGAICGPAEPARFDAASVNAWLPFPPISGSAGFGSIWIAENRGDRVARLDAVTGEPIATVDVGPGPTIGQPADGYMWMRTESDIVAIDPRTNTVVSRLPKAEVGPTANRFRAIDGALWICDGPRLHRYDPTTLSRLATIELGVHCGNITATPDLVVVFPFRDETPPVAVFLDPAKNHVVGRAQLPAPVFFATVQADTVFFVGFDTAQAAVVDRATWAVTSTPDLGTPTVGGTLATDGASIYVPAASSREVLVVDSTTFAVVDTIEPLDPWSVAFSDGGIWVVPDNGAVAQRFER